MTGTPWRPDSGSTLGLVAESTDAALESDCEDAIESAVADTAWTTVTGTLETVLAADPSMLVAVEKPSLSAIARAGASLPPILPVETGPGVESVSHSSLASTLETVFEHGGSLATLPVLTAELPDGRHEHAVFDAMLVTSEPARISEYGVHSHDTAISQFRADGVVVATPAGSHGYASAAGGPLVAPSLDVLITVPIAPFVIQTKRWVLPNDDLQLTVERDGDDVLLQLDGTSIETVPAHESVTLSSTHALDILTVA